MRSLERLSDKPKVTQLNGKGDESMEFLLLGTVLTNLRKAEYVQNPQL